MNFGEAKAAVVVKPGERNGTDSCRAADFASCSIRGRVVVGGKIRIRIQIRFAPFGEEERPFLQFAELALELEFVVDCLRINSG